MSIVDMRINSIENEYQNAINFNNSDENELKIIRTKEYDDFKTFLQNVNNSTYTYPILVIISFSILLTLVLLPFKSNSIYVKILAIILYILLLIYTIFVHAY